jgi:Protein kinase domain
VEPNSDLTLALALAVDGVPVATVSNYSTRGYNQDTNSFVVKTATTASNQERTMGAAQSRKHNNKPLCFFLPPLSNNSPHCKDAIGSPEPDTPVAVRKRRNADDDDIARFSVSDFGLEKELGSSSTHIMAPPPAPGNGQIHEGPDCEKLLQQQYELREVLGVGSSSTVHRCVSRLTGESFACKVIDCQQIDERFQGMMNQFLTEIEALRQLSHPGIIQLYDVYITTGDKIFIIMELLEGGRCLDWTGRRMMMITMRLLARTKSHSIPFP